VGRDGGYQGPGAIGEMTANVLWHVRVSVAAVINRPSQKACGGTFGVPSTERMNVCVMGTLASQSGPSSVYASIRNVTLCPIHVCNYNVSIKNLL
jgi:hypothetical protein